MKEIELTPRRKTKHFNRVLFTQVDDDIYEKIKHHIWFAKQDRNTFYAQTVINDKNVSLHRLIFGLTNPKIMIDHIDHNGLNNQKSNLRICTARENNQNRGIKTRGASKYMGVSFHNQTGKWRALIHHNGVKISLGLHKTEIEAANAYDRKAIELRSRFTYLNFPENIKLISEGVVKIID